MKIKDAWEWFADGIAFRFDYSLTKNTFDVGFTFESAWYDDEECEYYPGYFSLNLGFLTLYLESKL